MFYGKPEKGEKVFRPVRTHRIGGRITRDMLHVPFKKSKTKFLAKVVYRENLGLWMVTSMDQPGVVVFLPEIPPSDWTSLIVTEVNEKSIEAAYDASDPVELFKLYPDVDLLTLGERQLRDAAKRNASEVLALMPAEMVMIHLSNHKLSEILELKYKRSVEDAVALSGLVNHLDQLAGHFAHVSMAVVGGTIKLESDRLLKLRQKLNAVRSDTMALLLT